SRPRSIVSPPSWTSSGPKSLSVPGGYQPEDATKAPRLGVEQTVRRNSCTTRSTESCCAVESALDISTRYKNKILVRLRSVSTWDLLNLGIFSSRMRCDFTDLMISMASSGESPWMLLKRALRTLDCFNISIFASSSWNLKCARRYLTALERTDGF